MSADTIEYLVNFIEQRIQGVLGINIVWYGGEPLLAIDLIEVISTRVLEICRKNNVSFKADMVTNGYLLTDENVRKLIECEVKTIQVTLDGDREVHDSRRFLDEKKGSFDGILSNLRNNATREPKCSECKILPKTI